MQRQVYCITCISYFPFRCAFLAIIKICSYLTHVSYFYNILRGFFFLTKPIVTESVNVVHMQILGCNNVIARTCESNYNILPGAGHFCTVLLQLFIRRDFVLSSPDALSPSSASLNCNNQLLLESLVFLVHTHARYRSCQQLALCVRRILMFRIALDCN